MTTEITTVIGQLSLRGGVQRSDAPNQVAVRAPRAANLPGSGKGDLFILIEALGDLTKREAIEQQLAETVRDTYYLARGSITASLRRALQAASDQLYRYNYKVQVDERIVAGGVAVVMCGEDAFVAQIGPTALFAVLSDHIQRYPAKSVWLDEGLAGDQPKNDAALGIKLVIEPNLYHLQVSPDDKLVLVDSSLAHQLSLQDVVNAVATPNIKTAIKNLGKAANAENCSALALAVVAQGQPAFGSLKIPQSPGLSRFFQRNRSQSSSIETSASSATRPELAAEDAANQEPISELMVDQKPASETTPGLQKTRPWFRTFKKPAQAPDPALLKTSDHLSAMPEEDYYPKQRMAQETRVLASVLNKPDFEADLHPRKSGPNPLSMGKVFGLLGAGLLMLLALLGKGTKMMLDRVIPATDNPDTPRQAGSQAYRRSSSPVSWKLLRNIALVIPLLVGLIVGVSYLQKGRLREAEYNQFLTTAQDKFQQAQTADPNSAFGLMAEAEAMLVEAEKIKASQPEIGELRLAMAEEADKLGKVQRLYYLPRLYQYTDEGAHLTNIIVQGAEIYAIDAGNDRVFHHRMDNLGESLLQGEEAILLAARAQPVDDITIGELLDITWVSAGGNRQTSDLVILNSTGLLEYNPNWGITTSTLASPESFVLPVAVESFFGNFYVLDPQANLLLRYLPTTDGYSAPPENYFPAGQPIDLSQAIDFAIDGAIYILFKDGQIGKYESGQPVEFNVTGLDKPFSNPVSIFTAPDEEVQHIYIADAGNRRVVQLNKDGSFVRQFKPREGEAVSFANLQAIFVDEIGSWLYVLDSNNLYTANIPGE